MAEAMADPSAADFNLRLTRSADRMERVLEGLLAPAPQAGEIVRPDRLLAAMRHGALGGGKRLRPFLVIETAALFGASGHGVDLAAAALELIHCYSLVHDDLPAMDDDDLRRGRPTVHKAFDEASGVLAGDALLTLAFDVLSQDDVHADPAVRIALVRLYARSAGLGGMAGGQALDLAAESAAAPLGEDAIRRLQAMKTGALLLASTLAGAVLGGADDKEREAVASYGRAIGAAFQIADDILDAESDSATLGKRAGKDADRNKATLVSVMGVEKARRECDALIAAAIAALRPFGARADILAAAARFVAQRKS